MPSPAAHTLFGLTCFHLLRAVLPGSGARNGTVTGFILLASLAPDLDFVPGLILGDPSRYHQTLSHSLGGSFLIALVLGGAAWLWFSGVTGWRWIGLLPLFVLGHLFLDYFTEDRRPPIGFPMFWPFSDRLVISPVPVFPCLLRDPSLPGFWSHNLHTLLVEALILVPPWLVSRKLGTGRSNKP